MVLEKGAFCCGSAQRAGETAATRQHTFATMSRGRNSHDLLLCGGEGEGRFASVLMKEKQICMPRIFDLIGSDAICVWIVIG